MSDTAGQAAGPAAARAGTGLRRGVRWLVRVLVVGAGLAVVAAGALAVWLSRGPLDVTRLARRVAPALIEGGRPGFSDAALFWDRRAPGAPLVLIVRDPMLTRADGSVAVRLRQARIGILPDRLLTGRLRLASVDAADGSVVLVRAADGTIGLGGNAAAPAGGPTKLFRHWQHVAIRAVAVRIDDPGGRSLLVARIATLAADHGGGGITGTVDLALQAAGADSRLVARLTEERGAPVLTGTLSPFVPARLAVVPVLAAAGAVELPVGAGFRLSLGGDWQPRGGDIALSLGGGRLVVAGGSIPVAGGVAHVSVDAVARRAALSGVRLMLAAGGAGAGPVITGGGGVAWAAGGRANATLNAAIDRVAFADLGRYWPEGVAAGGRAWVTTNIVAGTANQATLALQIAIDGGGVTLTHAQAQLHAHDLTAYWLRPVPPLVHAEAVLSLQSPDVLTVAVATAEQTPSTPAAPPLVLSDATVRITGLTAPDQTAVIDTALAGPVAQTIALLSEPRLKLLSAHPIAFGTPAGQLAVRLHLVLPLIDKLPIERLGVHATATLAALHLGGVIAGKDLDAGQFALEATQTGLTLTGTAQLAGVPSRLAVAMDFRAGPPGQVLASYDASGSATTAQMQAAGLPTGGLVDGDVAYTAQVAEHRDGSGVARLHADLRQAALSLGALGWAKARDTDTVADATVRLDHDQLVAVDGLSVVGPGVSVIGRASYQAGKPVALTFEHIVLGQTDAAGELRFATAADPVLQVVLHGAALDLSSRLKPDPDRRVPGRAQAQAAARLRRATATAARPPPAGRPWRAQLTFERVILGPGHDLRDVAATAANDGRLIRTARVTGTAGAGRFAMTLAPAGSGRALHGQATDAGGLLHALDLVSSLSGGTLQLDAAYDDTQPDHPLAGTALIDRFRIIGAPSVARLLQAMTLYGVMDVLRGPGLGITHLVAPFGFADGVLTLGNARAFSGSLGFTAKGEIDLPAQRADLTGTIVPAYFFNTLLGKIPLLGKLFSPEAGGGVFAATYSLSGPVADPKIGVNPLAALTPGALRGLFGIFDTAPAAPPAAPGAPGGPPVSTAPPGPAHPDPGPSPAR